MRYVLLVGSVVNDINGDEQLKPLSSKSVNTLNFNGEFLWCVTACFRFTLALHVTVVKFK